MKTRVLVAIPIVAVVALAVFLQGWVLAVFAVALAGMCQFEVVRAMDKNGKPLVKWASFAFAGVLAALFLVSLAWRYPENTNSFDYGALLPYVVLPLFIVFALAAFVSAVFSKGHDSDRAANTIFTMAYPQLFFFVFYLMILEPQRVAHGVSDGYMAMLIMLLMVFLPAMFTDTVAYFVGSAIGKHKLCPEISPKKTVEGAVGGIGGGVLAGALVWVVFFVILKVQPMIGGFQFSLPWYIIQGAVLAVMSQFGDLSASMLKRKLGVKDFGKLLPGHGGMVDRMDSVMFCIPTLFLLNVLAGMAMGGGF